MAAVKVADMLVLTLSALSACVLSQKHTSAISADDDVMLALVFAWAAWTSLERSDSYTLSALCTVTRQLHAVLTAVAIGSIFIGGCVVLQHMATSHPWSMGSLLPLGLIWAAATAGLLVGLRILTASFIRQWCRDGRISRRVAVVGAAAECAIAVARLAEDRLSGVQVVTTYTYPRHRRTGSGADPGIAGWMTGLALHVDRAGRRNIDAVLIAVPEADAGRIAFICASLGGLVSSIYVAPLSYMAGYSSIERLGSMPAGVVLGRPLSELQLVQKAVFDRSAALLGILVALPLLLLIGVLVRIDSEGPALFRQQRTGYNNMPFTCLKFRTMRAARADDRAPEPGRLQQAVRGDARVTRVGAWLRRTSVDELPQLFNVLLGDMSLVGPRPHAPNTTAGGQTFETVVGSYGHRHRMKPGITGWAQINGWRGETRDCRAIEGRVKCDMFYILNWSFLFDLKILLRTVVCVFNDPGAY